MENIKIEPLTPLLNKDIINRAKSLNTTLLSDGMEKIGVNRDGCLDAGISPISDTMKVVGTALTIDTEQGNNLPIHLAIYTSKKDYVLVINGKNHCEHPYIGDLMASTAKAM